MIDYSKDRLAKRDKNAEVENTYYYDLDNKTLIRIKGISNHGNVKIACIQVRDIVQWFNGVWMDDLSHKEPDYHYGQPHYVDKAIEFRSFMFKRSFKNTMAGFIKSKLNSYVITKDDIRHECAGRYGIGLPTGNAEKITNLVLQDQTATNIIPVDGTTWLEAYDEIQDRLKLYS